MSLLALLACGRAATVDTGSCPSEHGAPTAWRLATEWTGSKEEYSLLHVVEVFHEQDAANAWWTSGDDEDTLPEIDFSTHQWVGYLSWLEFDCYVDERIQGFAWTSAAHDGLAVTIEHECGDCRGEGMFLWWEMWVTPIAPVERCDLSDLSECG